jgi:hypothetical protein
LHPNQNGFQGDGAMNMGVRIAGFVLIALGLVAIVMTLFSSEPLLDGLTLDTGVMLLVGGVVTLGLSGVMSAIETLRTFIAGEDQAFVASLDEPKNPNPARAAGAGYLPGGKRPPVKPQDSTRRGESPFPPRSGDVSKFTKEQKPPVDKARPTIDKPVEDIGELAPAESTAAPEIVSEEELYVVEERTIAGKPARVLSDGTVEAETDDGWMRFENVEHLEEYMEALRAQRS